MDKNGKILIVDDSKFNREILSEILNQYTVIEAKNGYEALEYMKADKNIALVLLDLVMPEMDGFEVLKYMNQNHLIDEIAVMIISINKDDQSIEKAYELGISGYITRPFSSAVVLKKVNNIISHYKRQKKLTTIINKQIYEKYKNNDMMIMILSHIVESRNGESGLHVLHIKKLTKLLLNILVKKTNQYSLTLDDMISIEVASSLHDIGKIAIPEEILNKPSSLTKEEMEVMKSHVIIGAKMLNSLPFYNDEPIVKYGYQICRWHHERYDGNGYPDGLKGEEIPIAAQVVSIVDAYDALTSKRVYKEAYSHEEALKMIQKGKCGVFNPLLIECLMDIESYIQNDLKINEFYEDNEYFEERTQEHLKDEGLNLSNLLYQDLYFEKSKYKFYSELSNNIQFEYSVVPPLLTLSKKDALLLNIEPKIIDPLSNEKVTKLFINNDFMELEEFYKQVGGNFEDVKRRLLNEEFIRKFVLKFKDDETFDNLIDAFDKADYKEAFRFIHTLKGTSVNLGFDDLYQASCNLTECLREKENLNDEELEEAGKLLQIVKNSYQKIIELIVQL